MDYISKSKVGKLIKISQGSSNSTLLPWDVLLPHKPIPTSNHSFYQSPIFRLSEYTTFVSAAPQCSEVLFPTSSCIYDKIPRNSFSLYCSGESPYPANLYPLPITVWIISGVFSFFLSWQSTVYKGLHRVGI